MQFVILVSGVLHIFILMHLNESILIAQNEVYTFDYNTKRGVALEFKSRLLEESLKLPFASSIGYG
jgi:hypothetical protein